MIALDTNILLRYLVQDDPTQAEAARWLIEEQLTPERPGYVAVTAVLELDWVLRSKFQLHESTVATLIVGLMQASALVFEHADEIQEALRYTHGDLADNILHRVSRSNGCSHTVTFDKKFARIDGVELLDG